MTNIIVSGALDSLAKEGTQFAELSYSRLGGYGDRGLADMIHGELKERGLAHELGTVCPSLCNLWSGL